VKDKLYRQLDNLWRGDTRKRDHLLTVLAGYVGRMSKRKPMVYEWCYDKSRLAPRPFAGVDPLPIQEGLRSKKYMLELFSQENIGPDYWIALPENLHRGKVVHGLSCGWYYDQTYDRTKIEITPSSRYETNVRIIVPPTWHRMIAETGVAFVKSRSKIVKLVQSARNKRTYTGGYTAWDVAYFDIKDMDNPVWVDGCLVRNGDEYALEPTFSKAFSSCKAMVVKRTIKELKDTLGDSSDLD
jgi:hypothetical protein